MLHAELLRNLKQDNVYDKVKGDLVDGVLNADEAQECKTMSFRIL